MKIATYTHAGVTTLGELKDDVAIPLARPIRGAEQHLMALAGLAETLHRGEQPEPIGPSVPRAEIELLAPVPRPGKFLCIGLNYRDHAAEAGMEVPKEPVVFNKFATSVVAHEAAVQIPAGADKLDYEAELAIVIGRRAREVSVEEAGEYILGYTCVNDISERGWQFSDGQWARAKGSDGFGPMGPAIVTGDALKNPGDLGIRLRLNGETMQDSRTDQLVFGVHELVAFLSRHFTLEPGDVISTGTPPGVGFARKPPVYLKDGDVMEVEIDGIGLLRNTISG